MKKVFLLILLFTLLPLGNLNAEIVLNYNSLVKISNGETVYFYASDGLRYAYPNDATYKTWYQDFNAVQTISASQMAGMAYGGVINVRPGVKMIKINTDPKTYAIDAEGALRWVKTENIAKEIFGDSWNKQIIDVPIAFFTNYPIGTDLESSSQYNRNEILSQSQTLHIFRNVKRMLTQNTNNTSPNASTNTSTNTSTTNNSTTPSSPTSSSSNTDNPTPNQTITTSYGTTYYIRPNGGTIEQCNGKTNIDYSTTVKEKNCAWKHPFIALPPDGTARIAGGDTLFIASGSYKMGYGAPTGTENCDTNWTYGCAMIPVPSGPSKDKSTRILGEGWNTGCAKAPELYGVERTYQLIDLTDSDNVEVQCLELTDHSSCVEFHSGSLECVRDTYPHGAWAQTGLKASDSSNVLLKNLNIHGLATSGIEAGRLTDWTIEDTNIVANGWVGFEGDIYGDDHNHGTTTFKRVNINWNGCGETYPGKQPTGCWSQSAGGYGDGFGTGATGGDWVFEDVNFLHNTSDGLDLLYHRDGGQITINRVHAEGNAGEQLKMSGGATITNSIVISNCGFFEGKSFTYDVDNCRAGGGTISLNPESSNLITLTNNTVYSEGDCILGAENAKQKTTIYSRNNIFYAGKDFLQPFENSCLIWRDDEDQIIFDNDYSVIYNVKDYDPTCPIGKNDICKNPLFTKIAKDDFNFTLTANSPAINTGYSWSALTKLDFTKNTRPKGLAPDIGAYEY